MVLERVTRLNAPLATVFEFFSDPRNLARITPPSLGFTILDAPARSLREGDRIWYRIRVAGIPLRWMTTITRWDPPRSFTDVQTKGPYAKWEHTHFFREVEGGVEMRDRVDYELPFGFAGRLAASWFVRRQLRMIFDYRESTIRRSLGLE